MARPNSSSPTSKSASTRRVGAAAERAKHAARPAARPGSFKKAIAAGSFAGAGMLMSTGAAPGTEASADVRAVREGYGLSREKFGRLAGFSVRSLANWESGDQEPGEQARVRLVELDRLRAALAGVIQQDHIATWLQTPNPGFAGLKPLEVVERGQIDRLWRMIFELESGVPA